MKRTAISTLVLLVFNTFAHAEGNNYGGLNNFEQGIGGRASGMGGAYVATADDVSSAFWNPAGLAGLELYNYQVGLQYAMLPNQKSMSYAGYAFQVPMIGNYAITWVNYSAGGYEGRDVQGEVTDTFNSSENALVFSYGRKVYQWLKGLAIGANLKVLYSGFGDFSALGHGLDVGAQWQPILYWDHTIGLNVQNLFQRIYWNVGPIDPSLVNAKMGATLRFLRSEDEFYFNHLVTAIDFEVSENQQTNLRAGIEYWYTRSLGIRAGFTGNKLTMGATYSPELYEIDYSYHYDPSELANNQHLLALVIRLK